MKRQRFTKDMQQTEKSIQLTIMGYLSAHGYCVKRMPVSIYAKKGLPDLWFGKGLITGWIECKSLKGKQSPEQRLFQLDIEDAKCLYILARSVEDVEEGILLYKHAQNISCLKGERNG